jgi:hypothetical protein
MIESTNAIEVFSANLARTNMLIEVMERNNGYNSGYQHDAYLKHREFGEAVKNSQEEQARKIEISCAEHAIISLATLFETYCKELVQELLYAFPKYFLAKQTIFHNKINELLDGEHEYNYEDISETLSLGNRFKVIKFFELHEIAFMTEEDINLVEYIYLLRNCFVHNAGRIDKKTQQKLEAFVPPIKADSKVTISKMLRTRVKKLIPKLHKRVMSQLAANP